MQHSSGGEMSLDLILKPSCGGCGSTTDLYGSNCKHMTLCLSCGKTMAENHGKCYECGTTITRLIREYNVRANSSNERNYFIGRFVTGLPNFSKKKSAEIKWSLNKEGLQGRQLTDALREKFKNKPWLLEDETGQFQYHGHLEGAPSATYYLLMMQGKEFVAIPAGSWYNFNKVAKYKQLSLEEAEEKIAKRKRNADGYQRWMMKVANNGAAAFGEVKFEDKESGGGGKGRKKGTDDDDDEGKVSDNDEDDEEGGSRKKRPGQNKGGDDDEEDPRGHDFDDQDDDIDKGDDWEHEEIFTDDDEAIGNDAEDREDLAPEIPPPPEIKQDEEEEEMNEEEGGLSKSGKELKELLGRTNGMNESDPDDDDDDDIEDDTSPVLAPKQKDRVKEEPVENSPVKSVTGSSKTPTTSKSSKGKRKSNGDDVKAVGSASSKKVKTENEPKSSVKEENGSASKGNNIPQKGTPTPSSKSGLVGSGSSPVDPVTEEEIRAVLMKRAAMTTNQLVDVFKARLRNKEDKKAFADILRKISKIMHKDGGSYVILRNIKK